MRFEYEVIRRIEIVTTVVVSAKTEEEAEAKILRKIEDGLADEVRITVPKGWDIGDDETDYQLR